MGSTARAFVKELLRRTLPGPCSALTTQRGRQYANRFERSLGLHRLSQAVAHRRGVVVLGGPFRGMRYVPRALRSHAVPKLLGSYESELSGLIEAIIERNPRTVVDVGCAEGYYAVGMALRLPEATVHAFDIDPAARRLCTEMAQANGVTERVMVRNWCRAKELTSLAGGGTVVICDCEGYELELLQPDRVAGLASTVLLVELHDCLQTGITSAILARFSPTHDITLTSSAVRDPSAYREIGFLSPEDRRLAVNEFRSGPMQWAYMVPRIDAGRREHEQNTTGGAAIRG